MRLADRALGVPACAVLTWIRRALDRRRCDGPVRRILFVKLAEQGATVLAYPMLRRAVERVGAENIYFMAFEENRFILDLLEVVPRQNVITLSSRSLPSFALSALRAIQQVRRLDIDTAIDMEFFARSTALLTYLSGARRRIGFHCFAAEAPVRGDLMTHRLPYNPYLHTMQMYRLMIEALDVDPAQLPALGIDVPADDLDLPLMRPTPSQVQRVRELLREASGMESPFPLVLLNPNAGDMLPIRKWEGRRFVELARRLLQGSAQVHIALTGAPDEARATHQLAAEVGDRRCFSVAGKTTLDELLVLYTLSEVMVTNDSGPSHFASLTPMDVVTLFGPENPNLWGARTPRNHILWAALPCSPCINAMNHRVTTCTNNLCMQRITVDQVLAKVTAILQRRLNADRPSALAEAVSG